MDDVPLTVFGPDIAEALLDPLCALDLHTAASVGDLDHILSLDVDLDSRNRGQWSPVMYAAYYDHCPVVDFLVCRGGQQLVCAKNGQGRTALMMSAMCGNDAVAELLISGRYCDKNDLLRATDDRGMTPLFHAVVCGHGTLARLLLEAGADPNITENKQGEGHEGVVQCLLQHGADAGYCNILGENARSVASKHGHDRIARLLGKTGGGGCAVNVLDGPAKLAEKLRKRQQEQEEKDQLLEFCRKADVEKYVEVLKKNGVADLDALMRMTDEDLKNAGVALLGPRRKLTSAIARHRTN